jgi:UDP-3-O-[3-hydroxymyristoyl] glucosamine N-acyltransferase
VHASLGELARLLDGELIGDPARVVSRIAPLETADADSIGFLAHPRYVAQLQTTAAGCVIVSAANRDAAAARGAALVCAEPYVAFARLTQWWASQSRRRPAPGVHPTAVVEPGARLHPSASIGPHSVIGAGVMVEADVVIGAHGVLEDDASVGEGTRLAPRVSVGAACRIGRRGLLHGGVVIGADGFGFAPHAGTWVKIEQLGAVVIGDDVEIGANTCIDRGALDDTVLEDGVKLDNLVQIGHNVRVGAHSAFAGCVGVAGSARIGRRCTAGGGAIILGHLELVDDVHITAATVITRSIRKPGQYSGVFPFDDNAAWEKNAATLRQLHALRDRLRALENKT